MLEFEKCIDLMIKIQDQMNSSIAFVNIFAATTLRHERRRSTESSPRNVVTVPTTVHPRFQISAASSVKAP